MQCLESVLASGWGHAHSCLSCTALITERGSWLFWWRGNSIPGQKRAEWGDTSCSLGSSTSSPSTQHRDLSCPLLHQQVLSPPAPASLRALALVICACFSWVVLEQDVCGRLIIHCCQSRTSTSTTACVYITLYELAPLKESEIALFQLF